MTTLSRISGRLPTAPRRGIDPDSLLPPRTDLLTNRIDYIHKTNLVGKTDPWSPNTNGMRSEVVKGRRRVVKVNASPGATVGVAQPLSGLAANPNPWWHGGSIRIGPGGTQVNSATPYRRIA